MEPITTTGRVREIARRLAGTPLLAVDTEAAGYHRYDDRACLLQLSTRAETLLVDTLAVSELDGLRDVFADPATEIVIHDAGYDLRLLDRDFGATVAGLFDTKIAAEFLGEPAPGLANLLEEHLDVRLDKEHTLADWAARPLPPELLEYAADDTRHLPELRDRLRARLEENGRLAWAEEEFRLQQRIRWTESDDDGDAFRRLKGAHRLAPRQLAALRELYDWRESVARRRDRAPFRIVSNRLLVQIAERMPESAGALPAGRRLRRYATALVDAVRRGRSLPPQELPEPSAPSGRPARDPEFERCVDRLREVRTATARALDLDPGFLMPRSQLEVVARHSPASLEELAEVPGVRDWQIDALGAKLLAALRAEQD